MRHAMHVCIYKYLYVHKRNSYIFVYLYISYFTPYTNATRNGCIHLRICICIYIKEIHVHICIYIFLTPRHTRMRHAMHMNAMWHIYEWDISHIWTQHATHRIATGYKFQFVMSHIQITRVTHMNATCHVLNVTHAKEARWIFERGLSGQGRWKRRERL